MTPAVPRSSSAAPLVGGPDIRDAASLVIVKQDDDGTTSVLMGRRHPDTAFLPNKYVFPGGRFEHSDTRVSAVGTLSSHAQQHLMASVPNETRPENMHALALTAIRETFEETGVVIGSTGNSTASAPGPSWQNFFDTGLQPDPSGLHFFARAITPPGRSRRYDTRFFYVLEKHVGAHVEPIDDELDDIGWVSLDAARSRDIASITHHILADITRLTGSEKSGIKPGAVPFYFYQNDAFNRVLLSHQGGIA